MRFDKSLWSAAIFVLVNLCFVEAFGQSSDRLNKVISQMEEGRPALGVLSFDYSLTNARALSSSDLILSLSIWSILHLMLSDSESSYLE